MSNDQNGVWWCSNMNQARTKNKCLDTISDALSQGQTSKSKGPPLTSSHMLTNSTCVGPRGQKPRDSALTGLMSLLDGACLPHPNCNLCGRTLEDDDDQLIGHLQIHSMELQQKPYSCVDCDVAFAFMEDLRYHQQAAAKGNCGFLCKKDHYCTGHHHPSSDENWYFGITSTHQRMRDKLLAWETRQLHWHRITVVQVLAHRLMQANFDSVRYSVDNSLFNAATVIARLSQVSLKSFASLPCWWKAKDDEEVGELALSLEKIFARPNGKDTINTKSANFSRPRPESTVLGLAGQPALTQPDKQRFIFPSYLERVQALRGPPMNSARNRGFRRKAAGVASRSFPSSEQQHRPIHIMA